MKSQLTLYLSALLLSSCSSNHDSAHPIEQHDLSVTTDVSIDSIFSDVEVTPLRFERDTYPSTVFNGSVTDDVIIVSDDHSLIHVFAKDGHYISCSDKHLGLGPNDYTVLMGFFYNRDCNGIQALTPNNCLFFDYNCNVQNSRKIPTVVGKDGMIYDNGIAISSTQSLLTPTIVSNKPYQLALYDHAAEKILKNIDYSNDVIAPMNIQNKYFFALPNGEILFCPPAFSNYIYQINTQTNSISRLIELKYSDNTISKNDLEKFNSDRAEIGQYLFQSNKEIPISQLVNSRKIITTIKIGQQLSNFYCIVTDRKSGKNLKIKIGGDEGYSFPVINDLDEEYAYVFHRKEFITQNPQLLMGKAAADSILAPLDPDDYLLLTYKFR